MPNMIEINRSFGEKARVLIIKLDNKSFYWTMRFAMIYEDAEWISAVCTTRFDDLPHYSSTSDIHNSWSSRCSSPFRCYFYRYAFKNGYHPSVMRLKFVALLPDSSRVLEIIVRRYATRIIEILEKILHS